MSKTYELVYFDGRGRAEPIRLTFSAAGKEFVDKRVTQENWPKEKPAAPQGRVPYLVMRENKAEIKLSQSRAILRYLGREFDMYAGKDILQQAIVDQVIDTCADLMEQWEKAFFSEKAQESLDSFKKDTVPKFYSMLEDLIKANTGKGFAVGDKLSIADCMLFSTVDTCGEEGFDKFPSLKANRAKVKENKKIDAYLKARKQTPF